MGNDAKLDAKLQKMSLGPDWIDLSFGEPKVIMDSLFKNLNRFGDPFKMPVKDDLLKWEYQPAAGKPDLIQILEEKYSAKVVICNGAKQALAAGMHAFKQAGISSIHYDKPYYPSNRSITASSGLTWSPKGHADSLLITSPNNPDGKNYTNAELVELSFQRPMIHDAAYYTEIYLPEDQIPIPVGDIQVYSMSKMYGISGLRIGYAIVHNEKYYREMVNFMEMTTAGVSTASQDIARNIELFFQSYPDAKEAFHKDARTQIASSRKILEQLDPDVLQLVPSQTNSMFAWCKAGPALDAVAAKVYILDGTLFGDEPSMKRMNIAHPIHVIQEAVDRLNRHKKVSL